MLDALVTCPELCTHLNFLIKLAHPTKNVLENEVANWIIPGKRGFIKLHMEAHAN
jgi:hypothetical protein